MAARARSLPPHLWDQRATDLIAPQRWSALETPPRGHALRVGWIIEPQEGEILGLTSSKQPFLSLEIDLTVADQAKNTHPRYVRD